MIVVASNYADRFGFISDFGHRHHREHVNGIYFAVPAVSILSEEEEEDNKILLPRNEIIKGGSLNCSSVLCKYRRPVMV